MNKQNSTIMKLAETALLAALCYVSFTFLQIKIPVPAERKKPTGWLTVKGAKQNNLKNIDVKFPLGVFTCVTGVSGSGKSSLVNEILYKSLAKKLNRARMIPGEHKEGVEHYDRKKYVEPVA